MPAIHIRDVPEETLAALKRRAARHRRSLQMELHDMLDRAARDEPPLAPLPSIREELNMARDVSTSASEDRWSREDIYGDDGR
jgi:plasmid stability protein